MKRASSNKFRKELQVWLGGATARERDFLDRFPDELQRQEACMKPPRSSLENAPILVDSDILDDTNLQLPEGHAQSLHSDVVSARKLRDYYSNWDKFEDKEESEKNPKDPEEPSKSSGRSSAPSKVAKLSTANIAKAVEAKEDGNTHFKAGRWDAAITSYSKAMSLDPMNEVYPLNRAMAWIKKKDWLHAIEDSDRAISLNTRSVKGFFRKATALHELKRKEEALAAVQQVLLLEPKNGPAKALLKKIEASTSAPEVSPRESSPVIETIRPKARPEPQKTPTPQSIAPEEEETLLTPVTTRKFDSDSEPTPAPNEKPQSSVPKETVVAKETKTVPSLAPTSRFVVQVPSSIPKTSFEFERAFVNLKRNSDQLRQYIKVCSISHFVVGMNTHGGNNPQMIPAESYPKIFKSSMSSEIFTAILDCLATSQEQYVLHSSHRERNLIRNRRDTSFAVNTLASITSVGRFDTLVMFMSKSEKQSKWNFY